MSMIIYPDLVQGSEEWLAARCGILTASTIGKLITPKLEVANNETSRGLTATLVAERLTGFVEYVHPSFDMQRGTLDEPFCRDLYAEQHQAVVEIGFITNTIEGFTVGYSPDGVLSDGLGLLEIKSRKPRVQLETILNQEVPRENMAQLQLGMMIAEREWIDYCSYAGGWPLYVQRVYPDREWQTSLRAAITTLEKNAAQMIHRFNSATAGAPIAKRIDHSAEIEMTF